ncbi:hypothetical protein FHX74_001317 [Friedmanniella endophytica]|uniref:Uncharacterized protein n=1 Tax=Microlunatus kandeliicorticis TaxID=1759536 RepID=A0A7W3IR50_9ACTN|nr:hypothetical protein [Microlunatus kandeliicorticis]MBA8793712.1 hypothetical protein [Microlunatus kandeliicorticis]
MAQTTARTKQPQDPYARQAKTLSAQVQRLRGWLGSDPSRLADLTDALLALDEHRLLGHQYRAAGPDAQEAVKRSAELLLADGPVGPYTTAPDAVRCGVAFLQLAAVQVGLGVPGGAGRTLASWQQLHAQLVPHRLDLRLPAVAAFRGLHAGARAALADGDPARANGWADRAAAALPSVPAEARADGFLELDLDLLLADVRWAAGRGEESLTLLHRARDRYEEMVGGRFDQPGRHPVPLLQRLAEPLFGLHRDLADRLRRSAEIELALVTRRRLVELLAGLAPRLEDPVPAQLTASLTDLADDLLVAGRVDEAVPVAGEAVGRAEERAAAGAPRLLAGAVWARVLAASGEPDEAADLLGGLRRAEAAAAGPEIVAYADAVQQELTGAEPGADLDALRDAARGVLPLGPRIDWPVADPGPAYAFVALAAAPEPVVRPADEDWIRAERDRAHRVEEERLVAARREGDERRRAEEQAARAAAEREAAQAAAAAEEARRVRAQQEAAAEADRVERQRRREERLREHQAELDRRAAEERAARRAELQTRIAALSADAVGAESSELERLRLELASLAEPTRVEPKPPRAEPEPPRAEPAPAEPEAARAEPEPPRAEPEPTRAEPVEAQKREELGASTGSAHAPAEPRTEFEPTRAEPVEAQEREEPVASTGSADVPAEPRTEPVDEVEATRARWQELRAAGERKAARAELERLVELLRARMEQDFTAWALPLQTALDDLASARLRGGDLFGSRAAARESKAISRRIGIG